MRIAFRCDASGIIGSGHVMRCATLALKLVKKDAQIHFLCRQLPGHYCDWLEGRGFTVHRLTGVRQSSSAAPRGGLPGHVGWLGVTPEQEREESLKVLESLAPVDLLVVDHYALGSDWEKTMRAHARKIMAIDDLADRPHDCDLLLDQNFFRDPAVRYHGKVPKKCKLMLGPDYALLQDEYGDLHSRVCAREGQLRRILVFFGGTDRDDLISLTISAIHQLNRPDIAVDVVVSPCFSSNGNIFARNEAANNIELHVNLPTLAPLVVRADLGIGAAGTTTWERCCLGLPSLLVALAFNQEAIGQSIGEFGAGVYLGRADQVSSSHIFAATREFVDNPTSLHQMSGTALSLVDGHGVGRVINDLLKL